MKIPLLYRFNLYSKIQFSYFKHELQRLCQLQRISMAPGGMVSKWFHFPSKVLKRFPLLFFFVRQCQLPVGDGATSSPAERVLRRIASRLPLERFGGRVPAVVMQHMVYSGLPDRTAADRDVVFFFVSLLGKSFAHFFEEQKSIKLSKNKNQETDIEKLAIKYRAR